MKNNAIIGENIRSYREKLQLTQYEVANYLGVSREMISYYEAGKREIDLKKLEILADFFGIELLNLLEENKNDVVADLAFAYRSDDMTDDDLEKIGEFRKVIKNYLKMKRLEDK